MKTARTAAFYLTKAASISAPGEGLIFLLLKIYPPDKRGRDEDNFTASLKPYLDGIADAMKINDNRFRLRLQWCEPAKPGRVEITLQGQSCV